MSASYRNMRRWRFPVTMVVATCCILYHYGAFTRIPGIGSISIKNFLGTMRFTTDPMDPVFVLILCHGKRVGIANEPTTRQIQQTMVMMKSATTLTARRLRYYIIVDSDEIQNELLNEMLDWPTDYRNKITLIFIPVWYPEGRTEMINLGSVCVIERLFISEIIKEESAVIYVDTDTLFMRPPEDLWDVFWKFTPTQVAAMSPCLFHYGTSKKSKTPFFGKTGLNAGLIMMNLTRMREFPGGGFIEANNKAFNKYRNDIALADQDILNIVFSQYPDHLYELGCEWNYRPWQCRLGKNTCPETSVTGASLVHGNTRAFVSGTEPKLQILYDCWKSHEMGSSLTEFYTNLTDTLHLVMLGDCKTQCCKLHAIDTVLTQQLRTYLQNKNLLKK
uniref:UDP-D-xylose:beta-D-glucoside alpha-1,3-D-xylosyltransferase n=1 Tax=Hirondellea gigas TaxID=1518452 RepID=A0A2P2HYJ6_9CRUS